MKATYRSRLIVAAVGSLALSGCVELTELIEGPGADTAEPARASASAPQRSNSTAATRTEVAPLHQRANQNTFHEDDASDDDGGSDAGGGGFDGGGFDDAPDDSSGGNNSWTG